MDEKRFGHDVAQKTEPGQDRAERSRLRHDVEEFDLERIARFRALDRDRTGQRVNGADLEPGEILFGGLRRDLAVDRVAGLDDHLFALADLQHRLDVGVVAVVPDMRLRRKRLAPVDTNFMHGDASPAIVLCARSPATSGVTRSGQSG